MSDPDLCQYKDCVAPRPRMQEFCKYHRQDRFNPPKETMTTDNDLDKILLNYLNEIIKPDYINKVDAPQYFYDAKAAIQAHYQAREAKAELEALQWATGGIKEFTEDGREVIFGRMEALRAKLKKGSVL